VIALIYLQVLDSFWMRPLMAVTRMLVNLLLTPLSLLVS